MVILSTACATLAPTVNRGDAVGTEDWRSWPLAQQMGWRVDIRYVYIQSAKSVDRNSIFPRTMFNISHVRERHNVILVAEYLHLHDLPADLESSNGAWKRTEYHQNASIINHKRPSMFEFANDWYDWISNSAICK